MQKHLHFICPTDQLEMIIEKTFQQENYFYTSLANSVVLDSESIGKINSIIESENIKEVTFLLSRDNEIVQDALENLRYTHTKGMRNFYRIIDDQMKHLNFNQEIEDIELFLISGYLNEKINELRFFLNEWLVENITINALIYNRKNSAFIEARSALFKLDHFCLN